MNIHQIQTLYDSTEDRVILRLSTSAGEESRSFLTRRFIKALWPNLQKTLEASIAIKAPIPETRKEVLAFEHQKVIQQGNFSTPFKEGTHDDARLFPLGETPFLVTNCQMTVQPSNSYVLTLHSVSGQGIEINLDQNLLHALCQLLEQATRHANWDLPFLINNTGQVPSLEAIDSTEIPPKHLLN